MLIVACCVSCRVVLGVLCCGLCCVLFNAWCLLAVVKCLVVSVDCSLFVVMLALRAVWCWLFVVRRVLLGLCGASCVVSCLSSVGVHVLFVA